jgi:hypothetical protein
MGEQSGAGKHLLRFNHLAMKERGKTNVLGYFVRSRPTAKFGLPDLPVALVEDVICVGGSLLVASLFAPR